MKDNENTITIILFDIRKPRRFGGGVGAASVTKGEIQGRSIGREGWGVGAGGGGKGTKAWDDNEKKNSDSKFHAHCYNSDR